MTREKKQKVVEELIDILSKYRTIGLIDLAKLPTKQLQLIKKEIENDAIIKITKKTLIKLAIRNLKKEKIEDLEKMIPKQPGLILTNMEPFKFYKRISSLKYSAYAKENDLLEKDVLVKAGPTDLLPGPVISELTKVGIVAGVESGKVVIRKDAVIAKKGSRVSKELASVLRKLKIEPIEIGLNISVLYEDGKIYSKDVLKLIEEYPDRFKEVFSQALNLSIAIGYPTKENIKYLFIKAYQQAKALERIGGVS